MALTKDQKNNKIKELDKKIKEQKSAVFVAVDKIKNKDLIALRNSLREVSADLTVSKKTLTKIAFSNNNINLNTKELDGQFGIVFGYDSEVLPAKVAYEFSKKNENLNILGGLLENNFIDTVKVNSLALLPSKEVLYTKMLMTMNAPLSNLLNVFNGNIRDLVSVLSKIKSENN